MFFPDEVFHRKIEKIAHFLREIFAESGRRLGCEQLVADFFEENRFFLQQTLRDVCENIMQHIISLSEAAEKPIDNNAFQQFHDTLEIPPKTPQTQRQPLKNSSDFDLMKSFIQQFESKKRHEFEELSWKLENCKLFMDEKTQRFFEMSNFQSLFSAKALQNKENFPLNTSNRPSDEEKLRLVNEIKALKEVLGRKDNELQMETRRLMEKEKNLLLEEEANSFKSREILNRSKKIGEKELFLLLQSKTLHKPSKSFSDNFS